MRTANNGETSGRRGALFIGVEVLVTLNQNLHLQKAHAHILLQHRATNCVLLTRGALVTHLCPDNLNNNAERVSGHLLVYFAREGTALKMYKYIFMNQRQVGVARKVFSRRINLAHLIRAKL
jgi:hypothetical protein